MTVCLLRLSRKPRLSGAAGGPALAATGLGAVGGRRRPRTRQEPGSAALNEGPLTPG
ncbi:hypothetical protein [Streptomyces sp. NPDC088726]|uniref:hypothetical protein n=1 Tax=Streptomyces sp. NPDC088726 TaxID=3365874 RepID=UPI003818485B